MNLNKENEILIESKITTGNTSHEDCYKPCDKKLWCEECVPCNIIEGCSGNHDIDKFIRDTIYKARYYDAYDDIKYPLFLEWVPFDKFINVKQIGEGGFAKVYSATWIDGNAKYIRQDDGSWKKSDPKQMKVALKKLNGSQRISADFLNELKTHWDLYNFEPIALKFYGITRDPKTNEFIIIMQFADKGSLRCFLSNSHCNKISWKDRITFVRNIMGDLKNLHKLGYSHKDFHSGNVLQHYNTKLNHYSTYISDFGLSGPSSRQKSDSTTIYGVLPYIAPEVLNRKDYTLSSDIYSAGIIMTECSSGKPPFYERNHDLNLALEICGGLRPEFGKGTPEIYKKLAYKCMDANPNKRPTASELNDILYFWLECFEDHQEEERFGYKSKEVKAAFEAADKVMPSNISNSSYKRNPGAIYTSRALTFTSRLSKPINSSMITSYIENKGCQDSRSFDLEIPSSIQSNDIMLGSGYSSTDEYPDSTDSN